MQVANSLKDFQLNAIAVSRHNHVNITYDKYFFFTKGDQGRAGVQGDLGARGNQVLK